MAAHTARPNMAVAILDRAKVYLKGEPTVPPKTRALMALQASIDWHRRYRKHQASTLDMTRAQHLLKSIDPCESLRGALDYLEQAISLESAKSEEKP